jgi:hypothetical protein
MKFAVLSRGAQKRTTTTIFQAILGLDGGNGGAAMQTSAIFLGSFLLLQRDVLPTQ